MDCHRLSFSRRSYVTLHVMYGHIRFLRIFRSQTCIMLELLWQASEGHIHVKGFGNDCHCGLIILNFCEVLQLSVACPRLLFSPRSTLIEQTYGQKHSSSYWSSFFFKYDACRTTLLHVFVHFFLKRKKACKIWRRFGYYFFSLPVCSI